jgi:hypothetical protein
MPIGAGSSLADVCFEVCTELDRAGITAVLTGGSAATVYAPAVYQSRDADFVITLRRTGGSAALSRLGYEERGGIYHHRTNRFTLEFPRGPLAIGDDLVSDWDTLRQDDRVLYILTRTDCVRDRLLWFYVYNDRSALSAAIGVAESGVIDRAAIRDWSSREGYAEQCAYFFSNFKG